MVFIRGIVSFSVAVQKNFLNKKTALLADFHYFILLFFSGVLVQWRTKKFF